jgi:hypothetical protein
MYKREENIKSFVYRNVLNHMEKVKERKIILPTDSLLKRKSDAINRIVDRETKRTLLLINFFID